jgi:hypothetical protein
LYAGKIIVGEAHYCVVGETHYYVVAEAHYYAKRSSSGKIKIVRWKNITFAKV